MRTRKRVLDEEVVGAEVGWYVKFYVRGVSAHLKPQFEGIPKPVMLFIYYTPFSRTALHIEKQQYQAYQALTFW